MTKPHPPAAIGDLTEAVDAIVGPACPPDSSGAQGEDLAALGPDRSGRTAVGKQARPGGGRHEHVIALHTDRADILAATEFDPAPPDGQFQHLAEAAVLAARRKPGGEHRQAQRRLRRRSRRHPASLTVLSLWRPRAAF